MGGDLVVVFDRGAASAGEIAVGLRGLGPLTFLVAESPHTRGLGGVFERLGRVVPMTGDGPADLARLRPLAPAAILTFSEPMLPATARLAEALGLPFHSVAATRLLTNKIAQRERLGSAGVDRVRSRPVSSLAEWPEARDFVGLPAVVKPVHGQGSRNTFLVRDDASARRVLASMLTAEPAAGPEPTVLVEELLRGRPSLPFGDYVSVESACGPAGIRHLAVTGRLPLVAPFRETGRFWPARIDPAERAEITELVTRALRAVEVGAGLTHTEVKLTRAGPRIIEVNGRLGGHINGLARQAAGVDLVRVAGQLALGLVPDVPAGLDLPDRVCFQHNTLAPVEACALVGVRGAAEVRRVAGVDGFRAYARPGDTFDDDVMTRHLDLLWGRCDRHAEMFGILDEALHRLWYELRFAGGGRCVTAAQLAKGRVT
jgi:hypothetical protein